MTKAFLLALVVVAACAGTSRAGTNPVDQGYTRPTGSSVAIVGCFVHGGSATVPAGAPFTVFGGWGAARIGQVLDWVHGSTNTLSVDGGAPLDLSPYFRGLTSQWAPDGNWYDVFFYELPALAPGQSVDLTYFTALNHPMVDGVTNFPGPPMPAGGFTYTCTVTGAAA